jgi:hypothetical protein
LTHVVRVWFPALFAVLARPRLWSTTVHQFLRMIAPGWWRRPPFLPWPDPEYVRFRLETAYGTSSFGRADDVVAYLQWCRDASPGHETRARRSA